MSQKQLAPAFPEFAKVGVVGIINGSHVFKRFWKFCDLFIAKNGRTGYRLFEQIYNKIYQFDGFYLA